MGWGCPTSFSSRSLLLLLPLRPFKTSDLPPKPRISTFTSPAMASKTLEEPDVGISCFLSSLPGFRAVLKHRYADFIVREVDPDGRIIRLTSFDLPPEDLEEAAEEAGKPSDPATRGYDAEIDSFRKLSGEEDAESLGRFLAAEASGFFLLSPDADKLHRAEVHGFFKRNFKFLITDTVEEADGSKRVRVRFAGRGDGEGRGRGGRKRKGRAEGAAGRPFDSRGADDWTEDRGKFLSFHLFKENKDTQEAVGLLGRMLGIQPRSFGFAGTKDKRAVTTQRVTVFKLRAKRVAALNSRLIGIRVGDFSYVKEGLSLGQLSGNHFTITLRGVVADSIETINAAAEKLGKKGFINYFGMQRFGSGAIPTHHIGAALLKGDWEAAVGLILDPRDGERDSIREAREYYKESGDIDGTLRQLPRYLVAERASLQCLKKCPGNYLQALKAIPRTLRLMYVHSYQSYLWNHAATERVRKFGIDKVVIGDLVFCNGVEMDSNRMDYQGQEQLESPEAIHEEPDVSSVEEISDLLVSCDEAHPVKVVNSDDLLQGCYTIEDIVLPLPGSRAIFPSNDVAKVYHELANKDGISLTDSVHGAKEFSIANMTGGYRRVFQRPTDFSWELLKYTDANVPLAETDLDAISNAGDFAFTHDGTHKGKLCDKQDDGNSSGSKNDQPCSMEKENGSAGETGSQLSQTALKLSFTLPSSSYATMAIRELMKGSTTVAYHKEVDINVNTILS